MIVENNSKNIEDFDKIIRKRLNSIHALNQDDQRILKQILYVSFIDSLAGCIYPNRANKERFISLISRFSNWEFGERVCLLHLGQMVTQNSDPDLEKLRSFVLEQLMLWSESGIIRIDELPKYNEVKSIWTKSQSNTGIKYCLDDFKHTSLLYQLRNSLVHQFQSKGTEIGSNIPDQPYYQVIQKFEDNKMVPLKIELVYPTSFLAQLTDTVLDGVISYFKNGNLNPFPHYYAGGLINQ